METFTVQEPTKADFLAFLSLSRAKQYARVTWTVEDALFEDLLIAVVDFVEKQVRQVVVPKIVKTTYPLPNNVFDGWFGDLDKLSDPDNISAAVLLPYQPVISVDAVHHGARGQMTLLDPSTYYVNLERSMVEWTDEGGIINTVLEPVKRARLEVTYTVGCAIPGDTGPESPMLRAFRIAVAETIVWAYEHKGEGEIRLPSTACVLLKPYWRSPLNQRHRRA